MKFTGHERDLGVAGSTADDLDYMHARYYSLLIGRFLKCDPAFLLSRTAPRPQGWNRYAYARNNPLLYIDPTGLLEVNITVLGKTVRVYIDESLPKDKQKQLQKRTLSALNNINTNGGALSDYEKQVIGNIQEISVDASVGRSFVEESTGSLTFTPAYIDDNSLEWVGAAVGHDGYHVQQFNEGGVERSRGEAAEVEAMQFQERLGQKLGLGDLELDYLRGLIADPSQLDLYINLEP